jgi:hypothetical protein
LEATRRTKWHKRLPDTEKSCRKEKENFENKRVLEHAKKFLNARKIFLNIRKASQNKRGKFLEHEEVPVSI